MATTAPFDTSPAWGCDKYSDLTLRCGKNVFKVHKNIVCTQSKVFAAACDGGFQESITSSITIEEFDGETVQRMLEFLYKKDYDIQPSTSKKRKRPYANPYLRHILVQSIADYYDLPRLVTHAMEKLELEMASDWDANLFMGLVTKHFDTGNTDFQNTLIRTAGLHIDDLLQQDRWATPDMAQFALLAVKNMVAVTKAKRNNAIRTLLELQKWGLYSARISKSVNACLGTLSPDKVCGKCGSATLTEEVATSLDKRVTYIVRCLACQHTTHTSTSTLK